MTVAMQQPTLQNVRIRTTKDADLIFHAVRLNILPMVLRRLGNDERDRIRSGDVYVWEERPPHQDAVGMGIERWTDGRKWGPSRVKDDFLFYRFAPSDSPSTSPEIQSVTTKQTYSVHFKDGERVRKWHMTAYFDGGAQNQLLSPSSFPALRSVHVPAGMYTKAKQSKPSASSYVAPRKRRASSTSSNSSAPSMTCVSSSPTIATLPGMQQRGITWTPTPERIARCGDAPFVAVGTPLRAPPPMYAPRTREDEQALARLTL